MLVVEDQADLRRLLCAGLERDGYRCIGASSGEEGLRRARQEHPDLLVLDVSLPGMDGFEVCRMLRRDSRVPILFLTARDREIDELLGLRLGADDYIKKPFSLDVVLTRVQAALRRVRSPDAQGRSGIRGIGGIDVDLERHELRVDGRACLLTDKEYRLLAMLVEAGGKVLTRAVLLERIWGYSPDMDVDTRTLDQLVSRLRRKLGSERERLATLPGYGYRLLVS